MPSDVPPSLRSYCALQPEHRGESIGASEAVVDTAGNIESVSILQMCSLLFFYYNISCIFNSIFILSLSLEVCNSDECVR